jgi:hypothetical protein
MSIFALKHIKTPGINLVTPGEYTVTPGEYTVTPGLTRGSFQTTAINHSEKWIPDQVRNDRVYE